MEIQKYTQASLSSGFKKLWTYALIVQIEGIHYIKYGDHRSETPDDVIKYALDESLGKFRGLLSIKNNLIGYWDMTEHALSINKEYDPNIIDPSINYKKGYDNEIRNLMPIKKVVYINDKDGRSLELHPVPESYISSNPNWRSDIAIEWDKVHKELQSGSYKPTLKSYIARDYLIDSFNKVSSSNKHLLAAATGAGKEASTLALLIHIHKIKNFSNNKLNVAVATIPSTISELLNELATVSGMNVGDYGFIDFSSIKIYITRQWHDSYINNCNYQSRQLVKAKAVIIDKVSDIPLFHDDGVVPVLFGSYHDIAQKSGLNLNNRYKGLPERIGTFSIGEAHQMLSNSHNTMWKQLNHSFNDSFKLFITGTPYDFIYSKTAAEYFNSGEYSLFTRNDLYKDKRLNPQSDFINYPDFNFYGIDVKEIVNHLKTDENWHNDGNGFTWQKLFTFNPSTSTFKYQKSILWLFTRLFGSTAFDENGDKLSIYNAPNLCEKAKQHIMVTLPPGNKSASAKVYISALKTLLINNGIFQGTIFDAYDDNLGERKNDIASAVGSTLTLTCIRDCTGANIPELGTFVFLRNIGDSIKFFEQATGRVGRVSDGKINCGVFIGDLEASMAIMVNIEEKLSIDRDQDHSTRYIIDNIINNYNYFTAKNGQWVPVDIPLFSDIIEQQSAKGAYGVNQCIKITNAPANFELKFNNSNAVETSIQNIIDNGNSNAKNKNKSLEAIQYGLSFVSENNQNLYWNNMKLKFAAKCRLLAFVYNTQTVLECVKLIDDALKSNNTNILKCIGNGVEYFPSVMSDHNEIDIPYTNRWIQKIHDNKHDGEKLLEILEDPIHRSEDSFIAEPNALVNMVVYETLSKLVNDGFVLNELSFFDPCAGRGSFIIELFKIAKELNQTIDPSKVFYNDIDPVWYEFFCTMNKELNLNIPSENISNHDFFSHDFNKVNVILINPPYSTFDTTRSSSNHKGQGNNLAKKCTLLSLSIADTFVTSVIPYGERTYSQVVKNTYIENGLYKIIPCLDLFKSISSNPCAFFMDKSNVSNVVDDQYSHHQYEIPKNNIGSIMKIQPGCLDRNEFEHMLEDSGQFKVIVTSNIIKHTNDTDLINKLNDRTLGSWRVVINCTTQKYKIGKILVTDPSTSLSSSVNCFMVDSEEDAIYLKNYLESEFVSKIINDVKIVNASNSKKFFQFIPLPEKLQKKD